MDLTLNNLQRLICHKTQTNKIDSATKIQILDEAVCISLCVNTFGNDINLSPW